MKNVLYIGNNLIKKTSNISGIQILGPLLENEGLRVTYTSSHNNKFLRIIDMAYSCLKYAKKVDVVLIDTYSTQNFYYAYIIGRLCKLLKLEYIPILHGGNLPSRLKNSPNLSQKLFKNAFMNVSPSLYLKEAFEAHGINNIIHIPNAIEIAKYPLKPKEYRTVNLLWVRSFSEIYNPLMAVEVLKLIKAQYSDATLCMVGPDSDGTQSKVQQLANTLDLQVKFTGKLTKEEWITLSENYNIFINTTNFDNTPVSVMEAMALGLPVVSTNVGGIPYLIQDEFDGLLVNPNDSVAMAKAINELIDDKVKRKSIISNARRKVESFDWDEVKKKWLQLLKA
ncbi:glycosyltransferase family 4 protein [Psychroserpens sp. XS_ASV72]|uniref:glycosyltransferase family 4 protein n=1 Tax=Psychroserpens sp. XS_ASV72 TaxID=3241293 RepID=UPI003515E53E